MLVTMFLKNKKQPDGYNTIKAIEFTIDADYDKEADDSLKADIVNRKGSLLPSTGGMGTTILYVIGSILVLVAAILLITKNAWMLLNKHKISL